MNLTNMIATITKEYRELKGFFNNPFGLERWRHKYVELLNNKKPWEQGDVKFDIIDIPKTVLPGYFTGHSFLPEPIAELLGKEGPKTVPMLWIDKKIMMSLTEMELESHYYVISKAKGRVGVAGLGLGFYVQMIAMKEEVTSVVVYEINQNVIDLYNYLFEPNDKIKIVKQDIYELEDEKFDFFYCDIYFDMPDIEEGGEDYELLTANNELKEYYFWGWERAVCQSEGILYDDYFEDLAGVAETISFLFGGQGIENWPYVCEDCDEDVEDCECEDL